MPTTLDTHWDKPGEKGLPWVYTHPTDGGIIWAGGSAIFSEWGAKLQELEIYDTLNKELIENEFPGYYARHFKAQEAIELCSSDNDFRKFMEIFNWQHIYCREVIYLLARLPCQKLTEDDFVISKTGPDELIPIGASHISFRFEDEGDIRYSIIGELDITEGGFAANPSALKLAPKKVA